MTKPSVAADIMTRTPHTISLNETVLSAKKLLNRLRVRHVPVTEHGKLVGILSERDIRMADALYKQRLEDVLVKEVCVFDPYAVEESAPLKGVLEHLVKHRIGSAIVMNGEQISGIITMVDVCRAFAASLTR